MDKRIGEYHTLVKRTRIVQAAMRPLYDKEAKLNDEMRALLTQEESEIADKTIQDITKPFQTLLGKLRWSGRYRSRRMEREFNPNIEKRSSVVPLDHAPFVAVFILDRVFGFTFKSHGRYYSLSYDPTQGLVRRRAPWLDVKKVP